MWDKEVIIKFSWDEDILNGWIDAFARSHWWTEHYTNDNGDLISSLDHAKKTIIDFVKRGIKRYNLEQAKIKMENDVISLVDKSLDAISTYIEKKDI